jgi:hypothetical protein
MIQNVPNNGYLRPLLPSDDDIQMLLLHLPHKLPPSCANELILQWMDNGGGAWWVMYYYWAKLWQIFYRA